MDGGLANAVSPEQALMLWYRIVDRECLTLSTNQVLWAVVGFIAVGPVMVWLCPRPSPSSMWRTMFSSTTMASSTMNPTASVRAISERLSIV